MTCQRYSISERALGSVLQCHHNFTPTDRREHYRKHSERLARHRCVWHRWRARLRNRGTSYRYRHQVHWIPQ
ncbi:hypothetical protein BDU57DRAFT_522426 [Ampelomyces quisqualis]|uniref:Uncharacterized protein n=1 Tax=Ampelomyces quisqualis TaxID=50730 RepID=A0A6A5Q9Y5_AMPQU|nr:hypothetical protein BDU57DRAFT_522426 [Ampelomyces quisqualis]